MSCEELVIFSANLAFIAHIGQNHSAYLHISGAHIRKNRCRLGVSLFLPRNLNSAGSLKKLYFFKNFFFNFFFSFYMYIQIFSADATIALKKIKIIFLDSSQLIFSPSLSETTLIWLRLKNAINKKLSSQIPIQNRFSRFLWLSTINKCKNKNFKVKLSLLKKVLKQFEQSTLIEFVNNW